MKKIGLFLIALVLIFALPAGSAFALETAPDMGGYTQDAEGFSQCFSDYMEYYVFGINAETRNVIKEHVKTGYSDGSIQMMTLMTGYANLRKAGQVAEVSENQVNGVQPATDVIKQYYKLTEEQKASFKSYLVSSFSSIGLTADISDGAIKIEKSGAEIAVVKLTTIKPISTTRMYLNAYIPALTDSEKDIIDTLIAEYAAAGGSPAGSGAMWRCIREVGTLMGVEATSSVDMAAGTVVITVSKAGVTYLLDCTDEVQAAVVDKVKEGFAGIGCTVEYENGVFTILKDNSERLTYTLHTTAVSEEDKDTAAGTDTSAEEESASEEDNTTSSSNDTNSEIENETDSIESSPEGSTENNADSSTESSTESNTESSTENSADNNVIDSENSATANETKDIPKTGEASDMFIYAGLVMIGVATLSISTRKKLANK